MIDDAHDRLGQETFDEFTIVFTPLKSFVLGGGTARTGTWCTIYKNGKYLNNTDLNDLYSVLYIPEEDYLILKLKYGC